MADLSFWLLAAGLALALDLASFWSARDSRRAAPGVDRLDELAGRLDDAYDRLLRRVAALWQEVRAAAPRLSRPETGAVTGAANQAGPVPAAEPSVAPLAQARQVITVPSEGDGSAVGLARVDVSVYVPAGTTVRVTVEASGSQQPIVTVVPAEARQVPAAVQSAAHGQIIDQAALPAREGRAARLGARLRAAAAAWRARPGALALTLFLAALGVYAVTRLWALDRFPIYFFGDETINVLYAEQLLKHGLRDGLGRLLPLYWEADGLRWTPLLSVYVHLVSLSLFGKSLFVTRATSALVSLMGTAAVALVLKEAFKLRFWWVGALLLGLTPAWFLHSRTAFETVMMSSFYACFLLAYLLYRTRGDLRYLYAALVFGAMAFYTYSNGQSLVAATAAGLLISDGRYLWQQRARLWRAGLLVVVLALPLVSFLATHATAFSDHLRRIDSYVYQDVPTAVKAAGIARAYLFALSPQYLFAADPPDLDRHVMLGYGHMRLFMLPLVALGVLLCLRHWRSCPHRAVLISVLAAPVGAALAGVGITRVLSLCISAALLGGLGLDLLLRRLTTWLAGRPRLARVAPAGVSLAAFGVLAAASLLMLRDAVVNGPLWYRDYGLYGMQYGATQLFAEAIPSELKADPNVQLMVASSWANGADRFADFFLTADQRQRVTLRGLDYYLFEQRDLANVMLVLTPGEYEQALSSGKFKLLHIDQVLPYPDGNPGFYFVRPVYIDNVAELFAAEAEARRQPVEETIDLDGELVTVVHSRFDAGGLGDLFDHDRFSLARGLEANPLVIELRYPTPHTFSAVELDLGSMASFAVTATLTPAAGGDPRVYAQTYNGLANDPHIRLVFDGAPPPVSVVRLEIKNLLEGDRSQIHVRDVALTRP